MRSSKRFSFSAECTFVFEDVVDKNNCCYGINYLEPGLTFGFVSSLQEYTVSKCMKCKFANQMRFRKGMPLVNGL